MFLRNRFFIVLSIVAVAMALGLLWLPLFHIAAVVLAVLLTLTVVDMAVLYLSARVSVRRTCEERLSNGEDNPVTLTVTNNSAMPLHVTLLDEVPPELQERDLQWHLTVKPKQEQPLRYDVRPTRRGQMTFGHVWAYASSMLGLMERRFRCARPQTVKVYPSFLALRRIDLRPLNDHLVEQGTKRVRRVDSNTEFEQIKEYVTGDEIRHINWKASARRMQPMVNVYHDERSQEVYSVVDMGRTMQVAAEGMTLLDHSINAALALSFVAVNKEDQAGVATFDVHFNTLVRASRRSGQMHRIMETLYAADTTFGESDYSELCLSLNHQLRRRSFIVLFTAFDALGSLYRQLPYLRQINKRHRLLVVFFKDEELQRFAQSESEDCEDYYQRVVAEKMMHERRLIADILQQQGIHSVLTSTRYLVVDVVNKYLEMKARRMLT